MGGQWVKMSVLPCLSLIITIKNQFPESEFESIQSQGFTDAPHKILLNNSFFRGFPGGTVVENLPANAGDTGSSPGLGRSHMPRSN